MGFETDIIERAILYGGARSIEDCLPYLAHNEDKFMDH